MTNLTFQLVLGRDCSSRLIAWYGNGYGGFSHVDFVIGHGTDKGYLIGARSDTIRYGNNILKSGVRRRPPNYEKWISRARVVIPCTQGQFNHAHEYAESQLGKQYDTGAIFAFIIGRREHNAGRWICSALATSILETVGLCGPLPVHPSQVTPDSFRLIACAIGAQYQQLHS